MAHVLSAIGYGRGLLLAEGLADSLVESDQLRLFHRKQVAHGCALSSALRSLAGLGAFGFKGVAVDATDL